MNKDRAMFHIETWDEGKQRWVLNRHMCGTDAANAYRKTLVKQGLDARMTRLARDGDGRPAR